MPEKHSHAHDAGTALPRQADRIDRFVGAMIRSKRLELRLSQQQVGDKIGVTYQQVQKYENADNRIAPGKLYRLAQIFDVSIGYFFPQGEGDMPTPDDSDETLAQKAKAQKIRLIVEDILHCVFNPQPDNDTKTR